VGENIAYCCLIHWLEFREKKVLFLLPHVNLRLLSCHVFLSYFGTQRYNDSQYNTSHTHPLNHFNTLLVSEANHKRGLYNLQWSPKVWDYYWKWFYFTFWGDF